MNETVRHRIPQPPSTPAPVASGVRTGIIDPHEQRPRGWLALVMLLAAAVGFAVRAMYIAQQEMDKGAEQPFGLTIEERRRVIESFPRTTEELRNARDVRSHAVTTITLDDVEGKSFLSLRLQAFHQGTAESLQQRERAHKNDKLYGPLLKRLAESSIFGVPSNDPGQLRKDLNSLQPSPLKLAECSFADFDRWSMQGWCLFFAIESVTPRLESLLQILAQKHRQPAIFKWWPHVWGSDKAEHHTLMQTVVPATSDLSEVSSVHPVQFFV